MIHDRQYGITLKNGEIAEFAGKAKQRIPSKMEKLRNLHVKRNREYPQNWKNAKFACKAKQRIPSKMGKLLNLRVKRNREYPQKWRNCEICM